MPQSTRWFNQAAPTPTTEPGALVGPLFWEALPSGRLTHDLPAWRAYTGQPEPLPPVGWLDGAAHPDDRAAITRAWARAMRGGQAFSVTHRLRAADGSYRPFLTQGRPVFDGDGNILRVQGVTCDLSETPSGAPAHAAHGDSPERHALEQRNLTALHALLDMAAAMVEDNPTASGAGVAARVAEVTRHVLMCRRAALFKLAADRRRLELVAVTDQPPRAGAADRVEWGTGIPADLLQDTSLLARLAQGEVVIHEVPAGSAAGNGGPAGSVSVNVPMRVAGELVGLMRVEYSPRDRARLRDELRLTEAVARLAALVLERERLLAEREEARASALALRQANRRMDEFLGIASHELKTPLTTIKSSIQVLGRRIARGEAASQAEVVRMTVRALDGMTRGVTRMERLVNDLLDVSRIREGRLAFHEEPCDLLAIVRAGVEDARQQQPERIITLVLPEHVAEIPLIADADRIGQVLANYLMNALKYSQVDRVVAITVRSAGDHARVSVRDEGPGIPQDQQPHVWELFHRVPGIQVQYGSGIGVGLGLHICRNIVERHGGAVGVESEVGRGSTFWFELPRAPLSAE